jgi:tetratricopeptide (TPR) repeat protein
VLVFHILALWYRWLRPDPEFLAFVGGVIQLAAIISFLGLQTEGGKRLAFRLDQTLSLGRLLSTPRRACLFTWVLALLAMLALYAGSPLAARLYNTNGTTALEEGRYSAATRYFRQAVSLSPRDARAHYNLARAYEALNDNERSIDEYQVALELEDDFWPAYNNLGRLYIQARDDPDAALTTLLVGQQQAEDPLGQTVIGKNIAWAHIEKGLPMAALETLDEVLAGLHDLRAQGDNVEIYLAEAYRIQALAFHELESPEDARRAWQDSLGYALAVAESAVCGDDSSRPPPDCLDALRWAAEARERLAELSGGS